jgi:hypothetical protein
LYNSLVISLGVSIEISCPHWVRPIGGRASVTG